MNINERWCVSFASSICATPVYDFPVWEVLATVLVTALVTVITIRVSVKAATRETKRTIAASLEAEQRATDARLSEGKAAAQAAVDAERVELAAALSRSAHELEALASLSPTDPQRVAAVAQWRALRTTFAVSRVEHALAMYTYADLRYDLSENGDGSLVTFTVYLMSKRFADEVAHAATEWARTGEMPPGIEKKVEDLQADRARRQSELLARFAQEFKKNAPEGRTND